MNHFNRRIKAPVQQRINERQRLQDTQLSIQIAHSRNDLALMGRIFEGDAVDVSAQGVQLKVGHPVVMGSELDLWITMETPPENFFLHGVVKWSMPSSKASLHIIGIQLIEKPNTDFEYWAVHLQQYFKAQIIHQT